MLFCDACSTLEVSTHSCVTFVIYLTFYFNMNSPIPKIVKNVYLTVLLIANLSKQRIDVRDNTTNVIIRCCHLKNAHSKYERCNLNTAHLACKKWSYFCTVLIKTRVDVLH